MNGLKPEIREQDRDAIDIGLCPVTGGQMEQTLRAKPDLGRMRIRKPQTPKKGILKWPDKMPDRRPDYEKELQFVREHSDKVSESKVAHAFAKLG